MPARFRGEWQLRVIRSIRIARNHCSKTASWTSSVEATVSTIAVEAISIGGGLDESDIRRSDEGSAQHTVAAAQIRLPRRKSVRQCNCNEIRDRAEWNMSRRSGRGGRHGRNRMTTKKKKKKQTPLDHRKQKNRKKQPPMSSAGRRHDRLRTAPTATHAHNTGLLSAARLGKNCAHCRGRGPTNHTWAMRKKRASGTARDQQLKNEKHAAHIRTWSILMFVQSFERNRITGLEIIGPG